METDNTLQVLEQKLRSNNILLTMLVTMVSGFFLQQGVSGLLWLVCWVVTVFGLVSLGAIAITIVLGLLVKIAASVPQQAKDTAEEARVQFLNELYSKMNNNKK